MRSAKVESSPRLQRVRDLLADGAEHSTHDIIVKAKVAAVNSCVAELRDNGYVIEGRWDRTPDGARIFLYRMPFSGLRS